MRFVSVLIRIGGRVNSGQLQNLVCLNLRVVDTRVVVLHCKQMVLV